MLPDRVSNPGPLTYESDALPIALRGPARNITVILRQYCSKMLPKALYFGKGAISLSTGLPMVRTGISFR